MHVVGLIIILLSNYVTFVIIMFFIKGTADWRMIFLVNFAEFVINNNNNNNNNIY